MADEKTTTVAKATATSAANTAPAAEEYTAQEFAQAPAIFGDGVRDYTVLAAFQYAKKDKASKAEALKIVADFRGKVIHN